MTTKSILGSNPNVVLARINFDSRPSSMGFTEAQRKEFETLYNSLSRAGDDMKLSQTVDTMIALMLAAGEAMKKQIHVWNR